MSSPAAFSETLDERTLSLLLDSLEQPEGERADWLRQQTSVQQEVIDHVLAILDRHGHASPLETPLDLATDDSERLGQQVGDYQLVDIIGRGGMGVVYLGDRTADYEHKAAIKLIRRGAITPSNQHRFAHERQILASLKHPYIAYLLDGGVTADGDQYLIMEWIQGEYLHHYCQQHKLDRTAIVGLIKQIAEALQHAHTRLLVHGDIKPNNILVTDEGVPKILDFGIAQHLNEDEDDNRRAMSRYYASPEQKRHEKLSAASDVYSLCVLTRDLLTDKANPAVSTSPLPPELASVLARGMADSQDQRYTTMSQLSADLDRYQQHYPIDAHSTHWWYRCSRYIRRHRLVLSLASLASLTLVAATVISLWQAGIARYEKKQSEQFSEALVNLITAPDPYVEGGAVNVEDMLDKARDQLVAGEIEVASDVRFDLLLTLGQVYASKASLEKALEIADFVRSQTGTSHPVLEARATTLKGAVHMMQGEYAKAREEHLQAQQYFADQSGYDRHRATADYELAKLDVFTDRETEAVDRFNIVLRKLEGMEGPWVDQLRPLLHNDMGIAYEFLGELELARERYLTANELNAGERNLSTATQIANLASVERKLGHTDRAIALFVESLDVHYEIVGPEHREVTMVLADLALAYVDAGQAGQAVENADRALKIALDKDGPVHRNTHAAYRAAAAAYEAAGDESKAAEYRAQMESIDRQLREN